MMLERKSMAMLGIIIVASMLVIPAIAIAEDVSTEAVVSGTKSPPYFKWKWELPDEDLPPCTQIWPEPFGVKVVSTYMVATDDNGAADIQRVFIKVFYPDQVTEKWQKEAWELPDDDPITPCYQNAEIIWAIDQGVLNGCIDPALAADMKTELGKCEARAWRADFEMDYHQPPGDYCVVAYAVDTAGNVGEFRNKFTYYSLKYLAIDFGAGINFGEIVPCVWKTVSGDKDMTTPHKPTVRSGGNDPLWIKLHFTPMVGQGLGKTIEEFDAVFKAEKLVISASSWYEFTNPLKPCETEQIDFSIHAPMGTPADTYKGWLHIAIN